MYLCARAKCADSVHPAHANSLTVPNVTLQDICSRFMTAASTWENLTSDICAQRKLRSVCKSTQSDQSLRCPHEETLHPSHVSKCAQWRFWSDCAHVRKYVFSRCDHMFSIELKHTADPTKSCVCLCVCARAGTCYDCIVFVGYTCLYSPGPSCSKRL